MTPTRLLFRLAVRSLEKMCLLHKFKNCYSVNLSVQPLENENYTDIVTIAFNNDKIIPLHVSYVKKYFQGSFTHIIADNSTNSEASNKIREYCQQNNLPYVRLPKNHLGKIGPSYSHATALNWVYKYIISKRQPHFFGYTDHDLFPIKPINVTQCLENQHIYGPLRNRGNFWYLSAILSFFDFNYLKNKKVDFMPVRYDKTNYLDTGGGNWLDIYSKMDKNKITFCTERLENFREGDNRHQDLVEIFDEKWLHTINGSYWKQVSVQKEGLLENLIAKYEQKI